MIVDVWERFLQFVPEGIHDAMMIQLMNAASYVNQLDETTILEHRLKNDIAWENSKEKFTEYGYIEKQSLMSEMVYGSGLWKVTEAFMSDYFNEDNQSLKCSGNVCEIIALYNAQIAMGEKNIDFPALIETFEKKGAMLNGNFGTAPTAIYDYLDHLGYRVCMYAADQMKDSDYVFLQEEYETYILSTWNNTKNAEDFLHTMCITKTKDVRKAAKYVLHNDYTGKRDFVHEKSEKKKSPAHLYGYGSLRESVELYNSWNNKISNPVCVIGVAKNKEV